MMRIVMVELLNWASFRGTHVFNFSTEKKLNGYAIFGINSRGKTSFTNAIEWAMYGEAWTKPIIDSNRKEIRKLRPLVSSSEEDSPLLNCTAYREGEYDLMARITFNHKGKRWILARVAAPNSGDIQTDRDMAVSLILHCKDDDDIFTDSEAQDHINTILPKDIRRFFFIDGESVNEYRALISSTEENLEIRKNIEDILNFPILKRGITDLNSISKEYMDDLSKLATDTKTNRRLKGKIEILDGDLKALEGLKKTAEKNKETASKDIKKLEEKLKNHTSTEGLIERRKGVEKQLILSQSNLEDTYKSRRRENVDLWLYLLQPTLNKKLKKLEPELKQLSETTYEISSLNNRKNYLEGVLANEENPCPTCHQLPLPRDAQEHKEDVGKLKNIEEKLKRMEEIISSQRESSKLYNKLQEFTTRNRINLIIESEDNIGTRLGEIEQLEEEKKEVDRLLKGIDEKEINVLNKKLKSLREGKAAQVSKINRHQQDIDYVVSERSAHARKLMGSDGSDESSILSKKVAFLKWIEELWETVLDDYTQQAKTKIEERATETFRALTNNPQGYDSLQLNKGFGLKILDSKGYAVPAPSPGAQQVSAISLIDALGRTSDIEFPILFDTPGASIDQEHRDNIIKHFWSKRDVQLIILAHSGEFRPDEVEKENKNLLARTWELDFDKGINSTIVTPRVM